MADQSRSDVALLYRRAGFGLTAGELDRATSGGYQAAVEALVGGLGHPGGQPGDQPGSSEPDGQPGPDGPAPVFSAGPPPTGHDPAATQAHNQALAEDLVGLQRWWMDRMIFAANPLREKLTLYWHGHFATGMAKVRDAQLMYTQNQLFRTAGGGGFEELVQAVAKDGAMMIWLDTSTDKKGHPNENFAREMMELFTLGVGNYSQDDVTAAARGFTGWSFDRVQDAYLFRPGQHDYGTKTYLGQTGDWNGEDIVRIAVTQPESARFLAARLWSHFAYPVGVDDRVVADLVRAYRSGLSVSDLLRAMFLHPQFLSSATRAGLIKQPVEYVVGAARALGLDAAAAGGATAAGGAVTLPALAAALGQTLFDPPNVGGWGQNAYWLDTATADRRLTAAMFLAGRGDISVVAGAPANQRVDAAARLLSLDRWGPTSAAALGRLTSDPVRLVALALTSPEYVLA